MIRTSRQLKALVRNMSMGDSAKSQVIIRNYVMERFLERLSLSQHRNNLILKGGILVAALVGLNNRSTLDVDATLKHLTLNEDTARRIINDIIAIQIDDGMSFQIRRVVPIMDEADYPGIRIFLDTMLETMHTPLTVDFSTGDVITPKEILFPLQLLFENRSIPIFAYNLETVLSEKMETLLSRSTANTRMRDFYDIHVLTNTHAQRIDYVTLKEAFANTSEKRGSISLLSDATLIIDEIADDPGMIDLWHRYQQKFDYATDVHWHQVMESVSDLVKIIR